MTQDSTAGATFSPEQLRLLRANHTRRKQQQGQPLGLVRREHAGPAVASSAQQAMWFTYRLLGQDTTDQNTENDLLLPIAIRGPLQTDLIRRAFNEIVRRHESLRTVFKEVDGMPVQVVGPAFDVELPVTDLTGHDEADRDAVVAEHAVAEVLKGFDLRVGPLLRLRLLRLSDAEHVLVIVVHHIVFDRTSAQIVMRELGELYEAYRAQRPPQLLELPIQYSDYAVWEQEFLSGGNLDRLVTYWRGALEGFSGFLDLPTDRPRPATAGLEGGACRLVLSQELSDRLHEFARRSQTSMFVVMLASFHILLGRYANQEDVGVGACYTVRRRPELANLVGFLVNTMVLRGDLSGDPSFQELVRRVGRTTMEGFDHRELPIDRVVQEIQPERISGQNPLFQVMYAFQPEGPVTNQAPEGSLEYEWLEINVPDAQFDLVLILDEEPSGVACTFRYRSDLFDHTTIERLVENYRVLLEGLMDDPDRPVHAVPMMPDSERDTVISSWNRSDSGRTVDHCVHEAIAECAAAHPQREAVVFGSQRLTYSELNRRANKLAHYLRGLGAGPEVPVGVHLNRSAELLIAVLAVLKSGAAYVPLDPDQPADRLAAMVGNNLPLVVTNVRDALPPLPGVRLVDLDAEQPDIEAARDTDPQSGVAPHHLAYVLHTSGSTGQPKGAMITHDALQHHLQWVQSTYPLREDDRLLHKTPIGFDVSVRELLWPLTVGACAVVAEPGAHRDPQALAQTIDDHAVTVVHFVPAMLSALLSASDVAEHTRSLRLVVSSGEALSAQLQQRFHSLLDVPLLNLYGPAEATIDVLHWPTEPGRDLPALLGRPVDDTRIYVVDSALRPVPIGIPGELLVGGAQVGRGYLGLPGVTAERFIPDLFGPAGGRLYRTGDRVRLTPDGNVEFLGRVDFQVKIRGYRIEPGEVESALQEVPCVHDVVVVAREDVPGDMRLVAYVTAAEGTAATPVALRTALAAKLPEYMVPAAYVILDQLPVNANGKVDRAALPAYGSDALALRRTDYVAPTSDAESVLAEIWGALLSVDRVGLDDDFFELGGHSLTATQAVARLRDALEIEIPVNVIFKERTLRAVAAHVARLC
ncbi:amino acid adenylation domain-containing protein [Streptomyces sp. NPDC012461]|uniref:non-ribosomal peptide synthetase n=1 Tax=Streptomyces sp. NPDC012461 TaxID=3155117 RepID=UPI0033FB1370